MCPLTSTGGGFHYRQNNQNHLFTCAMPENQVLFNYLSKDNKTKLLHHKHGPSRFEDWFLWRDRKSQFWEISQVQLKFKFQLLRLHKTHAVNTGNITRKHENWVGTRIRISERRFPFISSSDKRLVLEPCIHMLDKPLISCSGFRTDDCEGISLRERNRSKVDSASPRKSPSSVSLSNLARTMDWMGSFPRKVKR